MMKSGLSQNEKLTALRHVIDNYDKNIMNITTQKNAALEKKFKDFEDWGLEKPDNVDWLMKLSKPIIYNYYTDGDCVRSLRVASCYSGAQRLIIAAMNKTCTLNSILKKWKKGIAYCVWNFPPGVTHVTSIVMLWAMSERICFIVDVN